MKKNTPDGADIQKNQKQILKLLYLHYWRAPRAGVPGVSKEAPGSIKLEFEGLVP